MIDKQAAVFGEVGFKMTDMLKLTVGLRYSDLKFDGVVQEIEQGSFGSLNVNTPSSGESKPLTPRFVLNFQPDGDTLYYASAAKGFRPGGINTQLPANCLPPGLDPQSAAQPFSPDSLWQYEIGSKNTLLDRHLTVSASAYYLKWKNIQQFVYLSCGLGFDYNLGEATGKGGDLELEWRANEALTLGFTAAYTDTYFTSNIVLPGSVTQSLPAGDQLVAAGDHLAASPWNIDLNGEYVWQTDYKPYVRLDYQYATAQHSLVPYQDAANLPNSDPTQPGLPAIHIFNLRAGVRFNGFDMSLFATNLTNYHTPIFVARDFPAPDFGLPDFDTNYFGRGYAPRTVGITAIYKY
jgi:iron complex outermembrane recepter protein